MTEIKSRYRKDSVFLEYEGELDEIRGIEIRQDKYGSAELRLDPAMSPQAVLEQLVSHGVTVHRYEVSTPPLHDIFLQTVGEEH